MKTIWEYFKLAVLVWGFLCLALVLYIVVSLIAKDFSYEREAEQQAQVDTSYKKSVGDINIKVSKNKQNQERLLISIYKKEKTVVTDYALPMERFDLGWLDVEDVLVYPMSGEKYRIILMSTNTESDHDTLHNYIWVLSLDGKLGFEKMIDLSDFRKIPDNKSVLYGDRIIYLPGFGEETYESVSVPVEVTIGRMIGVRPLLGRQNLDSIRHHYEKIIDARINKLSALQDKEMLEQYRNAAKELQEIVERQEYPSSL